jgi:hypothetical protein
VKRKNNWIITDRAIGLTLAIIVLTLAVAAAGMLLLGDSIGSK